jgi:hypothetical protein
VARLGDFTARLLQQLGLEAAAGHAPRHLEGKVASDGSARTRPSTREGGGRAEKTA